MAKGSRTLNPVDAHRKAERKKELKKNKEQRVKNREISVVKKDTTGLESEIRHLEDSARKGELDKNGQEKLESLRKEVDSIRKTKTEYVAAHPEHEKLVFPGRKSAPSGPSKVSSRPHINDYNKHLFGSDGLPLNPEKSIYYDKLLNPTGMPPPGAVYMEHPPLQHEVSAAPNEDQETDSDSEGDVPLPAGPPPIHDSDDDSNEDIPMPEGPPPSSIPPPTPALPDSSLVPLPFILRPLPAEPPVLSHIPPPPPGFPPLGIPPPPPGFPLHSIPPPPPGFPPMLGFRILPSPWRHQGQHHPIPLVKPYLHLLLRDLTLTPPHWSHIRLDWRPAVMSENATVSAEPELRDLKRESTAFVPTAVKRRKVEPTPQRMNAAPSESESNIEQVQVFTPNG
ncbi:WW domain binding protein 11-domain-containing protein [Cantharellus anzutake]|uniref:WW domain binding protein 11-domain-containing protein n=1 Tax=Cantharellus anzutake TaxID=1750568 RepID=UPI001907C066|nr:WW domain binding protein 11-domain-containing protein [Cantharellus anzutake]KAF8330788.1 WW domain binding protein 11-domain-containing protein [Cantharellus anzutake]